MITKSDESFLDPIIRDNSIVSENARIPFQGELYKLLRFQTEKYTMGDSSSVPVETAGELLASIQYTIEIYTKATSGKTETAELVDQIDLDDIFVEGQSILSNKMEMGKNLYKKARETVLQIDNISYQETLKEIDVFFKNYDFRYFSHEIPCMIDYQLSQAVVGLQGIEFINEYLRRYLLENEFCGQFDRESIISLLKTYSPDYREQLINIYEPVATNAIGLALLNQNIQSLNVTDADRGDIGLLFYQTTEQKAEELLFGAVDRLCDTLNIVNSELKEYLRDTAIALLPRINVLKDNHTFDELFLELIEHHDPLPDHQYHDGELVDDEVLRKLIDEINDCRYLSDKILVVKKRIHSLKDLIEVLNVCFWGQECLQIFGMLNQEEITILLNYITEMRSTSPDWISETGWESELEAYALDRFQPDSDDD